MGIILLDRSNKTVRLNKVGSIVYHHAIEILDLYSQMQSLVDDLSNTANGELSISASYTFGEHILPYIIASLRKEYPRITPSISIGNTKEITDLVRKHQLDVGIVAGKFKQQRLLSKVFAEDFMYIFAANTHPLIHLAAASIDQIKEEIWIVREVGSGTREVTDRFFDE